MRTLHMNDRAASTVGFLVAPAVPAIAFAFTSPGLGGGPQAEISTLVVLAGIFYLYALPIAVLLALPLFLAFRHYGFVGVLPSILGGVLIGALVSTVLQLPPASPLEQWLAQVANTFPFMGSIGAAAGLLFWATRRACIGSSTAERNA
jgi:hypothetical protein